MDKMKGTNCSNEVEESQRERKRVENYNCYGHGIEKFMPVNVFSYFNWCIY